ncbi:hypothetical protein JRQ81_012251 [Phrynocephalus forsythii]|uniref:histone acetyltransferase n=1 Tax=Phrynocephalus forsythii TaxID=171643 RepID=A0A9Q0X7I6_9SAUR|nr:hypothetical protein JRQ81_012251 [Phrynocephalus forsythii]
MNFIKIGESLCLRSEGGGSQPHHCQVAFGFLAGTLDGAGDGSRSRSRRRRRRRRRRRKRRPRAGSLGGGAPSCPAGSFRRGGPRELLLPASASRPQDEPSVGDLEELVRKLQVTEEEKQGQPPHSHRQPGKGDSEVGSGETPGDRGRVPMDMDLEPMKALDCLSCSSWASPRTWRIVENSSPGEEQMSMALKLRSWDWYLKHAGQCRRDICVWPSCQELRQLVRHIQACRYSNLEGCHLCNQLVAGCYLHAQHCKEDPCPAPFCPAIKPLLQKMPIWLLPPKVKHGKMVAAGTARAQRASWLAGDAHAARQAGTNTPRPGCVHGPRMSSQQPGQPPPFRVPAQHMGGGLRLRDMQLLPRDIPWSVTAFLRRTMQSFKFPEEKGQEVSARGKPAFETGLLPLSTFRILLTAAEDTTTTGSAPSASLSGHRTLRPGPHI